MSLKSRKSIDIAGPDLREEKIITFRREPDKTYTKLTRMLVRDLKTGIAKEGKDEDDVFEGPYKLTNTPDDWDEKTAYQDDDGNTMYMYFKKVSD
ncbi:hypothetical protein OAA09_01290 [bacterium]|nr:hypothetical protein [bacterium]